MNFNNKISLFRRYDDTTPGGELSILEFCWNIIESEYKKEITELRKETDKPKRDALKALLPCATISGKFSKRKEAGLIQHSGFICIDIDPKGNPEISDWAALRNTLAGIENVLFSALSASGKGVFLIMPILRPEYHKEHFLSIEMDFASIGLTIDPICKNVAWLRGISSDPEACLNRKADPYRKIYQAQPQVKRSFRQMNGTAPVDQLIKKLIASGTDITTGYDNWFELARALVNVYGESGREYFHALSQFYPGYKQDQCDRQYTACIKSPGSATAATIFELAKQHNVYLIQ